MVQKMMLSCSAWFLHQMSVNMAFIMGLCHGIPCCSIVKHYNLAPFNLKKKHTTLLYLLKLMKK